METILKTKPFDLHSVGEKEMIVISDDVIKDVDLIKAFGKRHRGSMLFDALLTQSVVDFVLASVIQEQVLPREGNDRYEMMAYQESQNLFWVTQRHLSQHALHDGDVCTVMTLDRLKKTHALIMNKLDIADSDKGCVCLRGRYSVYQGKKHVYPRFQNKKEAETILEEILMEYNEALKTISREPDLNKSLKQSVYLASWIFFQITAIHPFADGNGRTARILASRCFPQLFYLPVFLWGKLTPLSIECVDAIIQCRAKRKLFALDRLVYSSLQKTLQNVKWRAEKLESALSKILGAQLPQQLQHKDDVRMEKGGKKVD